MFDQLHDMLHTEIFSRIREISRLPLEKAMQQLEDIEIVGNELHGVLYAEIDESCYHGECWQQVIYYFEDNEICDWNYGKTEYSCEEYPEITAYDFWGDYGE